MKIYSPHSQSSIGRLSELCPRRWFGGIYLRESGTWLAKIEWIQAHGFPSYTLIELISSWNTFSGNDMQLSILIVFKD